MRFSGPFSVRGVLSRHVARLHPGRLPSWPFAGPRGVDPQRTLRPCFVPLTLLGFRPSELFPAGQLFQARRPAIPSRCSSRLPQGRPAAPPRVFVKPSVRHPEEECCIPLQTVALLGFFTLPRRSGHPGWPRLSTLHPLSTFASGPFMLVPETDPQRLRPRSPWPLPLSRAPAVLAFLAFRPGDESLSRCRPRSKACLLYTSPSPRDRG